MTGHVTVRLGHVTVRWGHVTRAAVSVCRVELDQWVMMVQRLLSSSKEACSWLVELLARPEGTGYLK